jgi:hypothetical protein
MHQSDPSSYLFVNPSHTTIDSNSIAIEDCEDLRLLLDQE